jgi:hypothetical protein
MTTQRKTLTALTCVLLGGLGTAPAHADSPSTTVTIEDAWNIRADSTNELAAFVNISRSAFCTPAEVAAENDFLAWLQGGEVGNPPDEYPYVAASVPVDVTVQEVADGNLRASGSATVPVELWRFEEGKSWAEGNLTGPCLDTDGLVDLTAIPVPPGTRLAAGAGSYTLKDNDWAGTGPRTNVWSESLAASVAGPSGAWTYTFTQRNRGRGGEYLAGASTFRLKPR